MDCIDRRAAGSIPARGPIVPFFATAPGYCLFLTNYQIHNYNTRNVTNYQPHVCRTNVKQFTILYRGPKIWNSLLKNFFSFHSLSKHLDSL